MIATPEYLDINSIGNNALVVAASLRVGGLCFKLCPARCDIVDACVLTDPPIGVGAISVRHFLPGSDNEGPRARTIS